MSPRVATAASAIALALLPPASAAAQQGLDATARADALFHAAKELRDAGQYADACPNFAESKRLAPGIGVTLYLADCYEHVGKTGSAWKEFRDAEKLARERSDPRAEIAHARAVALEPRLSGLTIVVPAAAGQEAPEVLLDGAPIPAEEWNVAMAVDPGDHVVMVTAHGEPARTFTVHVDPGSRGGKVRVGNEAVDTPPAAVAGTATGSTEEVAPASSHGSGARTALGLSLLGVGVAGAAIGTGFLLKFQSTANPPPSCNPPPKDKDAETASAIAFGVGGAAVIASMVVLLSGRHDSGSAAFVVAPAPLAGGAGAFLRGRF